MCSCVTYVMSCCRLTLWALWLLDCEEAVELLLHLLLTLLAVLQGDGWMDACTTCAEGTQPGSHRCAHMRASQLLDSVWHLW